MRCVHVPRSICHTSPQLLVSTAVVAAVVVVPFVHVDHERAKRGTRRARLHSR